MDTRLEGKMPGYNVAMTDISENSLFNSTSIQFNSIQFNSIQFNSIHVFFSFFYSVMVRKMLVTHFKNHRNDRDLMCFSNFKNVCIFYSCTILPMTDQFLNLNIFASVCSKRTNCLTMELTPITLLLNNNKKSQTRVNT